MSHDQSALLQQILSSVQSIQQNYHQLSIAVGGIQAQVNALSGRTQSKQSHEESEHFDRSITHTTPPDLSDGHESGISSTTDHSEPLRSEDNHEKDVVRLRSPSKSILRPATTSRIILTTYPCQSGINPVTMRWCHPKMELRGPVVVSRTQSTIRRRNGMWLTSGFL